MDRCHGLIREKSGSRYVLVQKMAWKSSMAKSTGCLGKKIVRRETNGNERLTSPGSRALREPLRAPSKQLTGPGCRRGQAQRVRSQP
jgi:hypothetical protein